MTRCESLTALLLALLSAVCAAQAPTELKPSNDTGVKPNTPYATGSGNVNLTNGNLTLQIPLVSLPGRKGLNYNLALVYDSKIWSPHPSYASPTDVIYTWKIDQPTSPPVGDFGWHLNTPSITNGPWLTDSQGNHAGNGDYIVTLMDGSKHALGRTGYFNFTDWSRDAEDGSGVNIDPSNANDIVVREKDGTAYHFGSGKIEDTNGNYISGMFGPDTLGRSLSTVTSGGRLQSIAYQDSSGTQQTITLNYSTITILTASQTPFSYPVPKMCSHGSNNCVNVYVSQPTNLNETVLSSVTLPDNTSYTFSYNDYGELSKIVFPTGGYVKYEYAAYQHQETYWNYEMASCADGACGYLNVQADFREVNKKRVCSAIVGTSGTCPSEDITVYLPAVSPQYTSNYGAEVYEGVPSTDQNVPPTSYQRHTSEGFTACDQSDLNFSRYCSPHEAGQTIYDSSGTVLKNTSTTYNTYGNYPMLPVSITTSYGNGTASKEQIAYDTQTAHVLMPLGEDYSLQTLQDVTMSIENVTQDTVFDYGQTTTPLRKTVNTYLKTGSYTALHILNRKLEEQVFDGSNNPMADTQYEYDLPADGMVASGAVNHDAVSGYRGNVTSVKRLRNTDGSWLISQNLQLDDAGNVLLAKDPGGQQTQFSYADNWNGLSGCVSGLTAAYLTQTTNAVGYRTQTSYYPCTSLVQTTADENDIRAGRKTKATYDLMNRPVQHQKLDGDQATVLAQTNWNYHGSAQPYNITETELATPSPSLVTDTFFDGVGRTTRTQLTSDPEGADLTDTTYDALGRVYSVTNPYRSGDPIYGTTYAYDALGRTKVVTEQDQNTVQTDYTNFPTVVVTDESGRKRQSTTDALGRLTQVVEPNPTTGSLAISSGAYPTNYGYDALGNLTYVNQVGDGTAPRTRSFSYDSLSRLLDATNPETGRICYGTVSGSVCNRDGYDADGNLLYKTDANGNRVSYGYDALNRLTGTTFSDSTPPSAYTYDQTTNWGVSLGNGIGRLTTRQVSLPGQLIASSITSYDAMGRSVDEYDCRPSNCAGSSSHSSATYDLAGHLTWLTYPSGRKVKFGYTPNGASTSAGRLVNVTLDSFAGTSVNYPYVSAMSYAPTGASRDTVYGNGVTDSTYDNNRLQPGQSIVTGTQNFLNRTFVYSAPGIGNNGNILNVIDNRNSSRNQGFSYDSLNRVTGGWTAATSGADAWNETFYPDPWGNLKQSGSYSFLPVGFDSGNHISQTGYTYDAAGNLLSDTFHNYAYDAESRVKSVDTTGATYTYDADGNRVRKDVGSDATEYIYFQGQPIAEYKPATGDWSDYIYANGKKIAKADSFDNRIHTSGNKWSNYGWVYSVFTFSGAPGVIGSTIHSGDKLFLRQWQSNGAYGGVILLFSDGASTQWSAKDQNGNWSNSDGAQQVWNSRFIDLGGFVNKTVSSVQLITEGGTQLGNYDIYYDEIAIVGSDGSVRPIYNGGDSVVLGVNDTAGITTSTAQVQHAPSSWDGYLTSTTYYHEDHLGTSRLMTGTGGWPVWQGTFLPFGQEWNPQITTNHYKFTGKERDAESSLDYFGARSYSSTMGRWMSPDWADKPEPVPYADLTDPQSLNLYGYVRNNPMSHTDADGHCLEDACVVETGVALYVLAHATFSYFSTPAGQQTLHATGEAINAAATALERTIANGTRAIPNPWGSKGAPDHQQKVKEEADKARAEAGPGETVLTGQKVQGVDSSRQPDVQTVGADGKTKSIVEVERKPTSKRNKDRQKEYDKLDIPHKTVPLPPRPKPQPTQ